MHWKTLLYTIVPGYLAGSLPFALWIPLLWGKGDPRAVGSGNVGATNVYRLAGIFVSSAVYILDFAKGAFPTLWAMMQSDSSITPAAIGLCTVLGHIFPCTLKFRGGKGVATASGVLMMLFPLITLGGLVIWALLVYATGRVSLASLTAVTVSCTAAMISDTGNNRIFLGLLWCLLFYTHRDNIRRLYQGKESSIFQNRKKPHPF